MDLLNKKVLTQTVRKLEPTAEYVAARWLPMKPVATEQTLWDIVNPSNGIAELRAADAEAGIVAREKFDRAYADLVDIAEKERFNVTDLRTIREAGELEVKEDSNTLITALANEARRKQRQAVVRLRTRADNRLEWMRWNALQGNIDYDYNGLDFTVDYGIPSDQTGVVPSNLWSDTTNATPFEDIMAWEKTVIDRTGVGFGAMVVSHQALLYLSQNQTFRDVMQYTKPVWSIEDVRAFLADRTGLEVIKYDGQYKDRNGTLTRFVPQNRVIFIPETATLDGGLGDVATCPHPHGNWTPGYYGWTEEKKDPYAVYVGVGIQAFPRVFYASALFNADVY